MLTIGGNVVYHVAQKLVPKDANPMLTMMLAYAVALVACAVAAFFYGNGLTFRLHWSTIAIGLGIAAIEIGFLLVYRYGGNVSTAPLFTSVALSLALIPIGIVAFEERLSLTNVVGIAFCIIGLLLISQR